MSDDMNSLIDAHFELGQLRAELAAERKASSAWCDNYNIALSKAGEAARERDALRAQLENQADIHTQIQMQLSDERDVWKTEAEKWIQRHIDITELFETAEAERDALRALFREEKVLNPTNFYAADRLRVRIDATLNKGDGHE